MQVDSTVADGVKDIAAYSVDWNRFLEFSVVMKVFLFVCHALSTCSIVNPNCFIANRSFEDANSNRTGLRGGRSVLGFEIFEVIGIL